MGSNKWCDQKLKCNQKSEKSSLTAADYVSICAISSGINTGDTARHYCLWIYDLTSLYKKSKDLYISIIEQSPSI